MESKYYAAHNVDQYVKENFFSNKNKGYFIDIGAHNGIDINNTYYFENEGWDGICFEPLPEIFIQLKQNRKCKLINKALSDKSGVASFFNIKGYSNMLSGLVEHYPQEHIARINKEIEEHNQEYGYIEVECSTFEQEVQEKNIDILSIDTEGSELAILKTIDFSYYNINVMVIEYNYHNPEIITFLNKNNFEIVDHIGGLDLVVKNKNYDYKK
jgi:FkbM family methyltransferase